MNSLQTALQQVLRQVREDTKHWQDCKIATSGYGALRFNCTCDFAERVEAEQARRWAASIEAAGHKGVWAGQIDRERPLITGDIQAAGLWAAQQERGSA